GVIGPASSHDADLSSLADQRPAAALFAEDDAPRPDFERALSWARQAAELGSADGQALLAYILSSGPEETRDPPEAERLYRKSAEAGCPQGYLGYGLALLRLEDTARYPEAAEWMRKAAESGLATGFYLLGAMLERGQGMAPNPEQAVLLYREAAQRGL